jgi:hypothetical protein
MSSLSSHTRRGRLFSLPSLSFDQGSVRQQLMLLRETLARRVYLIHDNALMFNIDFLAYNLVSIKTGVEAPNMNSIMERLFNAPGSDIAWS